MTPYWDILLWIALTLVLGLYLLVRFVLDCLDYRQRRRIAGYSQRYGAVNYMGTVRPNFRR